MQTASVAYFQNEESNYPDFTQFRLAGRPN